MIPICWQKTYCILSVLNNLNLPDQNKKPAQVARRYWLVNQSTGNYHLLAISLFIRWHATIWWGITENLITLWYNLSQIFSKFDLNLFILLCKIWFFCRKNNYDINDQGHACSSAEIKIYNEMKQYLSYRVEYAFICLEIQTAAIPRARLLWPSCLFVQIFSFLLPGFSDWNCSDMF